MERHRIVVATRLDDGDVWLGYEVERVEVDRDYVTLSPEQVEHLFEILGVDSVKDLVGESIPDNYVTILGKSSRILL